MKATATDPYKAIEVESRLYHAASVAKAAGNYPYDALEVKVAGANDVFLDDSALAVSQVTLPVSADGMTDAAARRAVGDYLTRHAGSLQGLDVKTIMVDTVDGERTVCLRVVSDNSAAAHVSLGWLVLGATSDDGWIGDLNRAGLGLVWANVRVSYSSGLADSLSIVDVARHSATSYAGDRPPDFATRPTSVQQDAASADATATSSVGYAGNEWYGSSYGIYGVVLVPQTKPSVTSGAIFGWVSTFGDSTGDWAQTGWILASYDSQPQAYIEYWNSSHVHQFTRVGGRLGWGTGQGYECQGAMGSLLWSISVGGTFQAFSYVMSGAPQDVEAMNEIQGTSANTLNSTQFQNVCYEDASHVKHHFNQAAWYTLGPYKIMSRTYDYQWTANHT